MSDATIDKLVRGELVLQPTSNWRSIIECSAMINNEEYIVYTNREITFDDVPKMIKPRIFCTPRLVISRPVFNCEKIPDKRVYSIWEKDSPKHDPITEILDSLYRMKVIFDFYIGKLAGNPVKVLIDMIATEYYDCMSGGCPTATLAIAKEIIELYGIDKNLDIYPSSEKAGSGKDGWYTVGDFLEGLGTDLPDVSFLFRDLKLLAIPDQRKSSKDTA